MYSETSSGEAAAMASGVGKRSKSAGVTLLTCASVVWAESRTEIVRRKGFS